MSEIVTVKTVHRVRGKPIKYYYESIDDFENAPCPHLEYGLYYNVIITTTYQMWHGQICSKILSCNVCYVHAHAYKCAIMFLALKKRGCIFQAFDRHVIELIAKIINSFE